MTTVRVLLAEASRCAVPGGRMQDAIPVQAHRAGYPRELASEALTVWVRAVEKHGYRKALFMAAHAELEG